ncbi:MAG: AAA family ATPase [Deltaproteobacteria bacterium]|nr:AAA family ATPase [Deltaproteobacteria bacterium]MBW1934103.1 AAA family ATPase [Deltaproteobacteria bacterium]MBW1976848.1 AAA family ATPase [Deltaproteobacteria bacterium]MBW2043874.1 AAA family ATPase [Deltaproteobacteria bacterium]MBW2300047.1 AAA family ATPase [Deltaproteobacteria bacterium]
MDIATDTKKFYLKHIPGARIEGNLLKAPCPLCTPGSGRPGGTMVAHLDPDSFFMGYFRCLNRCTPGGFPFYFSKIMGIDPREVPGYDPDREPYVSDIVYPVKNLNSEIKKFRALISEKEYAYFQDFGVSKAVVDEMMIGYNGRYLVYPYIMEDGNCYAARCVLPGREEDTFWHGDQAFFAEEFRIYNMQEIERCENGALFLVEGENNLLALRELGFPGIAVPSLSDLHVLAQGQLESINNVFLLVNHSPEGVLAARSLATSLGFKARILKWAPGYKRGYTVCQLAKDKGRHFRAAISAMLKASESFSPFASADKEHQRFFVKLERDWGEKYLGLEANFAKLNDALNGLRGINIMGGQPKAGKSCFFMQISTEMAKKQVPVIYYDFENGRDKIYTRTLCRLTRLSEKQIRAGELNEDEAERLQNTRSELKRILNYFRVVTDRKLSPEIMRRQIDFIQHETKQQKTLVVIDSLHKLPFKNLSERRTGIDEWLRHMEAIRDEQNVAFLVVSELSRGEGGRYAEKPDMGSFKESGDIEYSADNAMILAPDWNPLEPFSSGKRKSTLWLVASRENNPGLIAQYLLEYPYWGFREL